VRHWVLSTANLLTVKMQTFKLQTVKM
jgi:hypothetical protein